jgi:hypothetical protein
VPGALFGLAQVNAVEQKQQFGPDQMQVAICEGLAGHGALRPGKTAFFQPLGAHPQPGAVPVAEEVPAHGIALQKHPGQGAQALEAAAHVRGAGQQVDLCGGGWWKSCPALFGGDELAELVDLNRAGHSCLQIEIAKLLLQFTALRLRMTSLGLDILVTPSHLFFSNSSFGITTTLKFEFNTNLAFLIS